MPNYHEVICFRHVPGVCNDKLRDLVLSDIDKNQGRYEIEIVDHQGNVHKFHDLKEFLDFCEDVDAMYNLEQDSFVVAAWIDKLQAGRPITLRALISKYGVAAHVAAGLLENLNGSMRMASLVKAASKMRDISRL